MTRRLLLCAYDVRHERRLAAALAAVTCWSHGGQRSTFECFAGRDEEGLLAGAVGGVLSSAEDRLALFQPRLRTSFALGLGRIAEDTPIVYVG